jgi:TolA-binding protein
MKIALLILQTLVITAVYGERAAGQSLEQLNRFVQSQAPSAAATAFREARDLIKDGEWGKAEVRFNRFIAEFPKDREVAPALYWLAFSLKQQNKFPAADATLTRLIEQYPASTWVSDARAMRLEMAPRLKNSQVIEQGVSEANEEIRLAALQSLFEARKPGRNVRCRLHPTF